MADERTFHASRSKAALILLASIAFVVIGYFMRVFAATTTRRSPKF